TGEVGTGKAVLADAAAFLRPVTLELGGKSPLIVFGDASLENAISGALLGNFYSAGEVCSNGTRVFVHRSLHAAFVERLRARVAAMRVGDPLDPATQVGALISEAHLEKVLGFIARGRAQGARLVTGGARLTAGGLAKGCFVAPPVFDDCHDDMGILWPESFRPGMSGLGFEDEEEVSARAHATDFGLAGGGMGVSRETFDYVIVGAGSAGCVLADRLTEDGRHRVLVLEYGGSDRSLWIQMPTALYIPMNMARYDWRYYTEPEPHLGGRRLHTPRGKVLGGSSSINGLVYVRGNPLDFEGWEREGAAGWGYRGVLPYFKRAERRAGGGDEYRGAEGPLATRRGRLENPL